MKPDEIETTTASEDEAVPVDAATPAGMSPQWALAVVLIAIAASLAVRRLGRLRLTATVRRWLPVVYTTIWVAAGLAVVGRVTRGLPEGWGIAIGVALLMVAFASVGWLRSVVSGVAISIEGRIRLGDSIRIGNATGEVVAFGVRSVRLRAVDGSIHEIPNEKLVTEPVTNLSGDGGDSAAEVVVAVPRGVEPNRALLIAQRIAVLSPLASPRHLPEVFLEPSAAAGGQFDLRVRGWAFDSAYQDHFRSDVMSRLQAAFQSAAAAAAGPGVQDETSLT